MDTRRDEVERYRRHFMEDKEAADLYSRLAVSEPDVERASIFRELSRAEERHAEIWLQKIRELGGEAPEYRPTVKARFLGWLVRRLGPGAALPAMRALELDAASSDLEHDRRMASESRLHSRLVTRLGVRGSADVARYERWHRAGGSGTVRAAIFGVEDGLVSNLSIVMGAAGASSRGNIPLLAGVAGLFAGAFAMSAGEYISMRSQRELFERQISLEREELETMPDEERQELALLYRAKGIPKEEAERIAERLSSDPAVALDSLVREELGLDPGELGSPWGASIASFVTFALGALVPLLPVALARGPAAVMAAAIVAAIALFVVGASLSLVTGKSWLSSGLRMLVIGGTAAAITYGIGSLIHVQAG